MGKQKRHNRDDREIPARLHIVSTSRTSTGERVSVVESQPKFGSSKEAFKTAWTGASDEQRSEMFSSFHPMAIHGERRQKQKNHKKRNHLHAEPGKPNSAAAHDPMQPAFENEADRRSEDGIRDDSVIIEGHSRAQRRRRRRKLISMGLVPKGGRRKKSDIMQQRSCPDPPTQTLDTTSSADKTVGRHNMTGGLATTPLTQQGCSESVSKSQEAVPCAEKPSGRKATARQLATTPLMQTPHSETANTTHEAVTLADKPIGRAALARQLAMTRLMQPLRKRWDDRAAWLDPNNSTPWQRSAAHSGQLVLPNSPAVDEEDAESDLYSEKITSDGPAIYTKRASHSEHIVSLRDSFGLGLPAGLAQRKAKRLSFSSKAHSVPAAFVVGDITERFRLFSAAAHGKIGDASSDDSSESTSDGDIGEEAEQSSQGIDQVESSTAQKGVPEAAAMNEKIEDDRPTKFSDIMSSTQAMTNGNVGSKCTRFGSDLSGGRSSSILVFEQGQVNNQQSMYEGSQDAMPLSNIDDGSFDAHQAIEDVFNTEMRLTRELPAGKREPINDLEHFDENLTQESSDRRVTRSASKPATLVKRMDSVIPSPEEDSVIVRSMRLLDQGAGPAQSDDRDDGADIGQPMGDVDLGSRPARDPSSSPLSELSRIPFSPPLVEANEIPSGAGHQAEAPHQEKDGTIVVAAVEQTPGSTKKRKMTGRTSKLFSASKAKRTKSQETSAPAPDMDARLAPSTGQPMTIDKPQGKKRRRADRTRALLAEARAQLDAASVGGESETGDVEPGDSAALGARRGQRKISNSRKRSGRSSGTLANLDASNIIAGRSRRTTGKGDDVNNGAKLDEDVEDNHPAAQASDDVETETGPKKRARTGGKITDLDTSNILESRSRISTKPSEEQPSQADDPVEAEASAAESPPQDLPAKSKPKRKSTGKRSSYFLPSRPALDPSIIDRVDFYNTTGKKPRVPAGTSTHPMPPVHHERFGIIQEKLWREPFWLLIAVTFLNKTTGRAAGPIFWKLKEEYASPEALAEADQTELCEMIWHLGLQTQRSKRLIAMAKAWIERPPEQGARWRTLHYPRKGDGKGLKQGVAVEGDADEVEGAVEIGQFPGCGPYAMDSWRIFCRDMLRGVAEDYNGKGAGEGFVPEWQKVLPGDKELRACLRWMWLRKGWIWDHETGDKRRATEEEMEKAVRGEMEVADAQEGKFAAQAAGVEIGAQQAEEAGQVAAADAGGDETEFIDSGPRDSAGQTKRARRVTGLRGEQRRRTRTMAL